MISGVLHEDGLADVADAVRAGRTRERVLAILKDSRIGTFGAIAILLSVLARWQALEYLATPRVVETDDRGAGGSPRGDGGDGVVLAAGWFGARDSRWHRR